MKPPVNEEEYLFGGNVGTNAPLGEKSIFLMPFPHMYFLAG